jgi:hypothetical protein
MKRSLTYLLTAFAIIIIIFTLLVIFDPKIIPFNSKSNGPTNVAGQLNATTTWKTESSPYNLIGDVRIANGVQLTIEPGVTVNFNNYEMQVYGTLHAKGSINANITFNNALITFSPTSNSWSEQTNSGSIIQKSVLNKSEVYIDHTSPKLDGNLFSDVQEGPSAITIDGGAPLISNNTLTNNLHSGTYGYHGGYGIEIKNANNATVIGNTIEDAMTGIKVDPITADFSFNPMSGTTAIENNIIINNIQSGIDLGAPLQLIIKGNNITQNNIGLAVGAFSNKTVLANNNIYGNTDMNVKIFASLPADINASNNWWGTTDIAAISQSIYDSKNDPSLGTVTFSPILKTPNP